MNERSVVSFSMRILSRDNSYSTYFNSRLITCLAYQASAFTYQAWQCQLRGCPDKPDHCTRES